jgi:hypothetical protein
VIIRKQHNNFSSGNSENHQHLNVIKKARLNAPPAIDRIRYCGVCDSEVDVLDASELEPDELELLLSLLLPTPLLSELPAPVVD